MTKRVFIAATMQNDGKTTMSLGLIHALKKTFKDIGFIKPVGQRYLVEEGFKIILGNNVDTLIVRKNGIDLAKTITKEAREIVELINERGFKKEILEKFDQRLFELHLNPGTTADITATTIFLTLLSDLK